MDPLSVAVGAVALAVGHLTGRWQRRARAATTRDRGNVCGCDHGRHAHDDGRGPCNAGVQTKVYARGQFSHYAYPECACVKFVATSDTAGHEAETRRHALLRRVSDVNQLLPQLPLDLAAEIDIELKES